jgi:adenylate cyclase
MPFCGHCGERDLEDRFALEQVWSCRGCGGVNALAMAFCGRCGSRRGELRQDDLRLVTSLFADISGFTTLADTVDVEELHAIINPLIAGLAQIAERYDGFVAKYAGDALLCLFGAPVSHEDDAQRALLAALEMHAALPSLLESLGPLASGLTIHVGVNTGRVVAGSVGSVAQADYSVLGDSVILAQRLESVCPSGQTYVGASTHELCKDEFDFEDVGELQLKGKLTVVQGFRLVGRRRAGSNTARPLVGRDEELAELLRELERNGAAVVSGEPGVGKSRLLAELRMRATGMGFRWLPMRCLSYGASLPYWPFVDLLRQGLGLRIEDSPQAVHERLTGALPDHLLAGAARLLGLESEPLEPAAARRQVHDALAGMVAILSGGRPVTLAVEDVHWLDSASADALGELARTPGAVPLSLLLTTRDEGRQAACALAGQATSWCEVALAPLGPESVPLVAAGALGAPIAADLAALLLERTYGNPLFVEQLAVSLQEEGELVPTSNGLALRPGYDVDAVPTTVERVFSARVDSLPLAAAAVLSVAAAIGRVSRISLLDAVAAAQGTALEPLDELVAAGLLDRIVEQDEPAVAFHHALLQDVVYGRLLKRQRRGLHRSVADAGLALYGDGDETIDLLARHLYLAGAGEEAVGALLRAGRRAARLYANDAAVEHLESAVRILGEDDARLPDVQAELAELHDVRGDYEAAEPLFHLLRTTRGAASDWLGEATVLRKTGRYPEAIELLATALERDPREVPLRVELARTTLQSGEPLQALNVVRDGLRLLEESDDKGRASLLVALATIEVDLGYPEFGASHGRRAVRLLRALGMTRELVTTLRLMGAALPTIDRCDEAVSCLTEAIQLAERIGHVEEAAGSLLNLALVHKAQQQTALAIEVVRQAAGTFERLGHPSGQASAYSNLADFLLGAGEPDEALAWAERSRAVSQRIGNALVEAVAVLTMAEIHIALEQRARAHELAEESREMFIGLAATELIEYAERVSRESLAS